jgi:hypothetical protein
VRGEREAMRGPKSPAIELSDEKRQGLEALLRRHTTPQQVALRARLILAAAGGRNNLPLCGQSAEAAFAVSRADFPPTGCYTRRVRPETKLRMRQCRHKTFRARAICH